MVSADCGDGVNEGVRETGDGGVYCNGGSDSKSGCGSGGGSGGGIGVACCCLGRI